MKKIGIPYLAAFAALLAMLGCKLVELYHQLSHLAELR